MLAAGGAVCGLGAGEFKKTTKATPGREKDGEGGEEVTKCRLWVLAFGV